MSLMTPRTKSRSRTKVFCRNRPIGPRHRGNEQSITPNPSRAQSGRSGHSLLMNAHVDHSFVSIAGGYSLQVGFSNTLPNRWRGGSKPFEPANIGLRWVSFQ